jgi:hypothetical protein
MSQRERLKVGEGQISGYISIFLAILALLGIFCFRYPEQLTTPEFREIYTKESMQILMAAGIIAAFFFALLSIILSKKFTLALLGSGIAGVAILLGAFTVQGRSVEKVSWHFGLDWMLLDLLLMTVIFIPLELFFPTNKLQTKFHEEWRTDLMYFVISHLFIQFFGIVTQKPAILFFGWMGLDKVHLWVQNLPFIVALFLAFFIRGFIYGVSIPFIIPHSIWIGWPAAVRILWIYFLPVQ